MPMESHSQNEKNTPNVLKVLEELVKCPICFDYLQAPVLLPNCQHNFCSLCIRKYLTHRDECPACRSSVSSNQLRSNHILAKVIQQFKILVSLPSDHSQNATTSGQVTGCRDGAPPSVHRQKGNRSLAASKRDLEQDPDFKVKLKSSATLASRSDDDSDIEILSDDDFTDDNSRTACTSKSRHSIQVSGSTRTMDNVKPRTLQSTLFGGVQDSPSGSKSPNERNKSAKENLTAVRSPSPTKSSRISSSPLVLSQLSNPVPLSMTVSSQKMLSTQQKSVDVDFHVSMSNVHLSPKVSQGSSPGRESLSTPQMEKVPCPVCGLLVVSQAVNRHLDVCLASGDKRLSLRPQVKRKTLPKLVYNLLSDKDLRKRLKQLGLNSQGDKQVMVKRHHEFTLLYNADCDSLAPKNMSELIKEFEDTHRLQKKMGVKPAGAQSILRFTKDSKKEDIEQANKEYASQHKNQFQSLVRAARQRMKMKAAKNLNTASSSSSSSDTTTAGDGLQECPAGEPLPGNKHSDTQEHSAAEEGNSDADTKEHSAEETCMALSGLSDEDIAADDKGGFDSNIPAAEDNPGGGSSVAMGNSSTSNSKSSLSTQNSSSGASRTTPSVFSCDTDLDTGEETCSDFYEYDTETQCVTKVTPPKRGRKALRSSKPSWVDPEATEACNDFSTSDRSCSQSDSSVDLSRSRQEDQSSKSCVGEADVFESCGDLLLSDLYLPSETSRRESGKKILDSHHSSIPGPDSKSSLEEVTDSASEVPSGQSGSFELEIHERQHVLKVTEESSGKDSSSTAVPSESCTREGQRGRGVVGGSTGNKVSARKPKNGKSRRVKGGPAHVSDDELSPILECSNIPEGTSAALEETPQVVEVPSHQESSQTSTAIVQNEVGSERNGSGDNGEESQAKQTVGSFSNLVESETVTAEVLDTFETMADISDIKLVTEESLENSETKSGNLEGEEIGLDIPEVATESESADSFVVTTESSDDGTAESTDNVKKAAEISHHLDVASGSLELDTDISKNDGVTSGADGDNSESTSPTAVPEVQLKGLLKKKKRSMNQLSKSVRFAGLRARISDIPFLSEDTACIEAEENAECSELKGPVLDSRESTDDNDQESAEGGTTAKEQDCSEECKTESVGIEDHEHDQGNKSSGLKKQGRTKSKKACTKQGNADSGKNESQPFTKVNLEVSMDKHSKKGQRKASGIEGEIDGHEMGVDDSAVVCSSKPIKKGQRKASSIEGEIDGHEMGVDDSAVVCSSKPMKKGQRKASVRKEESLDSGEVAEAPLKKRRKQKEKAEHLAKASASNKELPLLDTDFTTIIKPLSSNIGVIPLENTVITESCFLENESAHFDHKLKKRKKDKCLPTADSQSDSSSVCRSKEPKQRRVSSKTRRAVQNKVHDDATLSPSDAPKQRQAKPRHSFSGMPTISEAETSLQDSIINAPESVSGITESVSGISESVSGISEYVSGLPMMIPVPFSGIQESDSSISESVPSISESVSGIPDIIPGSQEASPVETISRKRKFIAVHAEDPDFRVQKGREPAEEGSIISLADSVKTKHRAKRSTRVKSDR